jgi:transposase
MDIHKKTWSISMRTDLIEHKTYSMPPSAEQLYEYVMKIFPKHQAVLAYEAGCCGFSVARYFMHLGWEVCVVNPADIPTMHKQNFQKTDKIDSRNLCKQLQLGNLTPINIPQEGQEQFRALLRFRMQVTRDLRRIKTHIKSSLLFLGIEVPKEYDNNNWSIAFVKWIEDLEWSNACGKSSMIRKLEKYQFTKKQYLTTGTELRAYAKKTYTKNYELLQSVPGVGGFTAAAFLAEIGDFNRFDNEAAFSSYIGVIPGIFNSGSSEKNLGVTPRANHTLRPLLVESVWVAVSKDPEIQTYYKSHIGKNSKCIVIKIAHKMARRIFAVIKTQTPYAVNKNFSLDPKIVLNQEALDCIEEHEVV